MKVSRKSWHYRLIAQHHRLEMWPSGLRLIQRGGVGVPVSSCRYFSMLLSVIIRRALLIGCNTVFVWLALQLLVAVPVLHFVYHLSVGEIGWIGIRDASGPFSVAVVQASVSAALLFGLLAVLIAAITAIVAAFVVAGFGVSKGVLMCMKMCTRASDSSLIHAAHDTYVNKVCTKVEVTD
jgi:hypothetical protein